MTLRENRAKRKGYARFLSEFREAGGESPIRDTPKTGGIWDRHHPRTQFSEKRLNVKNVPTEAPCF